MLRFFSAAEIGPNALRREDLERFKTALLEDALMKGAPATWRIMVNTWNQAAHTVPGWPAIHVPLPPRPGCYSLPWESFPASLRLDVDRYLTRLGGGSILDEKGPMRPARKSTLHTREYQIRRFASALVLSKKDPAELVSLADLVTLEAFRLGLGFFLARSNDQPTAAVFSIAGALTAVAQHFVEAEDSVVARMKEIKKRLRPSCKGLTEKNRTRLRQFDDPATVQKFLRLPEQLERAASVCHKPRRAALLTQSAVAIAILTMAPMRIANLAALDLDKHLVRPAPGRPYHIVIPATEVKNRQDLEFPLPQQTSDLIDRYLKNHRTALVTTTTRALFPGRFGGHKTSINLGSQISANVYGQTGIRANPHLFRHIGAKLYLDNKPGNYATMQRVLGHSSIDTTTQHYTGLETAGAMRHYDNLILHLKT